MSILGGRTINITPGPPSGIGAGNPVDSRAVTGSIVPDTNNTYDLGSTSLRYNEIYAASGIFGSSSVRITDSIAVTNPHPVVGIEVTQDGGAVGIQVNQNVAQAGIAITQAGDADGININKSATGAGEALQIANAGTGNGILLTQTGNVIAVQINQTQDRDGIFVDKTGTGTGDGIQIDNDGTGRGLFIRQNGVGVGLQITQTANADGLFISKTGTGGGEALVIVNAGTNECIETTQDGSSTAIKFTQNTDNVTLDLIKTSAGAGPMLQTANAGTGQSFFIQQMGSGIIFDLQQETDINSIEQDCTNATYTSTVHLMNVTAPASSGFNFCEYISDAGTALQFLVRGDGVFFGTSGFLNGVQIATINDILGEGGHVDERSVSGSIVPDTSGVYALGADDLRFSHVFATSGVFGAESVTIDDKITITNPDTNDGLTIRQSVDAAGDCIRIENSGLGRGLHIINDNNGAADTEEGQALAIFNNNLNQALTVIQNKGDGWATRVIGRPDHFGKIIVGEAENTSYIENMFQLRSERAANAAFKFISAFSGPGFADQEFAVDGAGAVTADGTFTSPADYAEYMECADPSGIAHGYAVQLTSGSGFIELATSGENLLGFVSARPGVVGDGEEFKWQGKYLMTDFGAYDLDEDGDRKLNPVWNSGLEYVSRSTRPEWVAVGLLGKLWIRTYGDQPVVGDHVALGASGMVQKATDETLKYRVIASGIPFDITKGYGTARIFYK